MMKNEKWLTIMHISTTIYSSNSIRRGVTIMQYQNDQKLTLRLKINIFFVQSWWFHAYCWILLEIWITQRVQTVLLLIEVINWRRFPFISAFYKPFYRPFMFMLFCIVIRNGTIVWKVVWIEYYLTLNLISRRYLYLG